MVDRFLYNIKIMLSLIKYNFKSITNYKKDFGIGLFIVLANISISLVFIEVLYNNITSIANWNKYEIILLYGISSLTLEIYNLFFGNLRSLKKYIFNGELETMMTKPLDIILHLKVREFDIQPLVNLVLYLCLVIFSKNTLKVSFYPMEFFKVLIFIMLGVLFISSLGLMSLSILFFTRYTYTPYDSTMLILETTKYPIGIFPFFIRNIILTIFPISIIGYLPTSIIISKDTLNMNIIFFLSVGFFYFVSRKIFRRSIRKYDGLGN